MRTEMRLSNAAMLSVLVDSAVACLLQVPSAIDEWMAALADARLHFPQQLTTDRAP